MTAKRDDLTYMTGDEPEFKVAHPVAVVAADAPAPVADPAVIATARKREALVAKRNVSIASFTDEEVEILWGSLDEGTRKAYLGG